VPHIVTKERKRNPMSALYRVTSVQRTLTTEVRDMPVSMFTLINHAAE